MIEQIHAAAKWWADILRAGLPTQEAGDATINAAMTYISILKYDPLTDEQIDLFELALVNVLTDAYSDKGYINANNEAMRYWIGGQGWGVDYYPGRILNIAAHQAGISVDYRLPVKTVMWLEADRVDVKQGYGASRETVWRASKQ